MVALDEVGCIAGKLVRKSAAVVPSQSGNQSLVVILHGYLMGPGDLRYVHKAVREELPASHVLCPRLRLHRFSIEEPVIVTLGVVRAIDEQIEYRQEQGWQPFKEIILIGHSCGALIARSVYIIASSGLKEPPEEPRHWAESVNRIVLFAAMNRGWSITHHLVYRFIKT